MRTVMDMSRNDEIWTPLVAVAPLFSYLPENEFLSIWEPCPGNGKLIFNLQMAGWYASDFGIEDALIDEPTAPHWYDIIVTNPPWSKKHLFLQRCVELKKPFALLLPVRTLGVRRCQLWLDDVDVLFLAKRVDFTGGGAPYEACAWFTKGFLPDRIVFEEE